MPERWRLVRNSFLVMTGLALVGFALYPLLPPRLLPESYGYFDTMAEIGGLWSFDSGAMQKVSNQYAAMPSLHFGWALWCFMVLYPVLRKRWQRVLIALYPLATLFGIVVTANHYVLDAARRCRRRRAGLPHRPAPRPPARPPVPGRVGHPAERRHPGGGCTNPAPILHQPCRSWL